MKIIESPTPLPCPPPTSFTITFYYKPNFLGLRRKKTVTALGNFPSNDNFMEWRDTNNVTHLQNLDNIDEMHFDKDHRKIIEANQAAALNDAKAKMM